MPRLRRLLLICARSAACVVPGIALLISCAHQVSPGGGPEDKTGPTIMITEPSHGAVRVGVRSRVVVSFSEWISRTAAPKAVSILPPLEGGVRVRVDGRRLEITPAVSFAESTTYHVVVTSGLQDLRGNALTSPFTLVFSTGDVLDSGSVSGCVIDGEKRPAGLIVGLFKDADSALFDLPDYLTQTDSAAYFSFENVRASTFRLVAFVDQNNNRKLDPGKEAAYAPIAGSVAAARRPDTVLLYPVDSDTAGPKVASAAPLSAISLLASLTKPADSSAGINGIAWSIEPFYKKKRPVSIIAVDWIGRKKKRCVLHLKDSLSPAPYLLIAAYRRGYGTGSVSVRDTMRFNGSRPVDTLLPALSSVFPTATVGRSPELRLHFTEPVVMTAPLALIDSISDTVALTMDSGYADTVVLAPVRKLLPGGHYRLVIRSSFGKDLAGNPLKPRDTTDTVLVPVFRVLETESLAVSLKGCVTCLAPDPERIWRFSLFTGGPGSLSADSGGCFSFDSIPAGKGFLAGFIDRNRNQKPDNGALLPWRPPEPYVVFADTVEARARWETEGIDLRSACRGCRKHVPTSPDSTGIPVKKTAKR
jgi:hypothetical protein